MKYQKYPFQYENVLFYTYNMEENYLWCEMIDIVRIKVVFVL